MSMASEGRTAVVRMTERRWDMIAHEGLTSDGGTSDIDIGTISREAAKPRSREAAKPRSREAAKPRSREAAKPRSREAAKPRSREALGLSTV